MTYAKSQAKAKSRMWNQIMTNVVGYPHCTINHEDIALLGQDLVAAAAVGKVKDLGQRMD